MTDYTIDDILRAKRIASIEQRIIAAAMTFHKTAGDAKACLFSENALDEACADLEALLEGKPLPSLDLPPAPKGGWLYAECEDAENWSGALETKELAIQEGFVELGKQFRHLEDPSPAIYVARGEPNTYEDLNKFISAYDVLETLNENMLDEVIWGDSEELEFVSTPAAQAGLEAWARKHIKLPSWCNIDGKTIERVEPPAPETESL